MKTILCLGASIMQVEAIKKAKEIGYRIIAVDYDKKALGKDLADEFYEVSTIDTNAVLEVAKKCKIDGVVTVATDMPVRTAAVLSEKLGIPGLTQDVAIKATDKIEMIKSFSENKVPSPAFWIVECYEDFMNQKEEFTYPVIFKPQENSGSRGVILVNKAEEAEHAYEYAKKFSKTGKILVEEYLEGPEVSVEVICENGKVHILAITDKLTTGAPFFVEMGHCQPSALDVEIQNKIKNVAAQAIRAIGIQNGPVHVEMKIPEGIPKMIELGARMGGDFITTHLVPLSTGIDMMKLVIQNACGERLDIPQKQNYGSAIRFFTGKAGELKDVSGIERALSIKGVKEVLRFKDDGSRITNVHNSLDRIGCVIAQGESNKDAIMNCEKALEEIKVNVS
ncbi:ATP-grasp domain-containing protein [uncultured Merdimonas sp.]|uniref:ATP-grasp domain-containing protein n=1 Tax=uncultured Merdimonas sp. TaxID=2023269 RepID=UPI00320814B7